MAWFECAGLWLSRMDGGRAVSRDSTKLPQHERRSRPWHTHTAHRGKNETERVFRILYSSRPDYLSFLSFSLWILVSKQGMNQALLRIGSRRLAHAATSTTINTRRMSSEASFPVTESIKAKLTKAFQPSHLDVINESHMHNV